MEWFQVNYLTSLSLSFPSCKMGMTIVSTYNVVRTKWANTYKVLSIMAGTSWTFGKCGFLLLLLLVSPLKLCPAGHNSRGCHHIDLNVVHSSCALELCNELTGSCLPPALLIRWGVLGNSLGNPVLSPCGAGAYKSPSIFSALSQP